MTYSRPEPVGLIARLNDGRPTIGDIAWVEARLTEAREDSERFFYSDLRHRMIAASMPSEER